jgi:predicted nuclease of predicted toxin-antitoxin system
VRFLVDTQLPAALARWLREKGHQAEYVLDVNFAQSKDTPIWRYAQEHGAVIVTKDEDFFIPTGPTLRASLGGSVQYMA